MISYRILTILLLLSCKKPVEPQIADPVPVDKDTTENSSDEENSDANDSVEDANDPVNEDPETEKTEDLEPVEVDFAEQINDATALLTSDAAAAQVALSKLQEIIKQKDDIPEAHYNIGVAYIIMEDADGARQAFLKSTEVDPTFSKSWYNLGVLSEREGDFSSALDLYEEGLKHNDKDNDLIAGRIGCYRKMGEFDKAIKYAQDALRSNSKNISAYNEIGTVYLDQGDYDKAKFILLQAVDVGGGENALIQSNLGKVYFLKEDFNKARIALETAVAIDSNMIDSVLLLSFIYIDNRAWDSAEEIIQQALLLEPNNSALLNAAGISKRGLGDIEASEEYYRKALEVDSTNLDPLLNLAVLESDYRNQYENAYALLDEYLEKGGTNTEQVDIWRKEFKKSEEAFIQEEKKRDALERMRKLQEEREKRIEEGGADDTGADSDDKGADSDDTGADSDDTGSSDTEDTNVDSEGSEDTNVDSEGSEDTAANDSEDTGSQDADEDTDQPENEEGNSEDPENEVNDDSTESQDSDTDQTEDNSEQNPEESDEANDLEETDTPGSEAGDEVNDNLNSDEEEGVNAPENENSNEAPDESTEDPQSEENTDNESESEEENDSEDGGWGSPSETDNDEGNSWGSSGDEIQTCSAINGCGSVDLQCSQMGVCKAKNTPGTYIIGEDCSNTSECAYKLSCVDNKCSE
jgi:tetratricopeptide (TPR) repeat protein